MTNVAVGLTYANSLPAAGFDLLIQVGNGSLVGAPTTLHKAVSAASFVEITGVVFANFVPQAPQFVNPLSGAIVSTSLDSHTATTDVNGAFDLQTGTVASGSVGQCYTLTVTSPGLPTFSLFASWGPRLNNQPISMSPPSPAAGNAGNGGPCASPAPISR